MSLYSQNGHANRREYLDTLADEYGLERRTVYAMASMLGHTEDFDGLVTACEDMAHANECLAA